MTNPIVSAIAPEIYANNTAHMSRAKSHTYNYASIDDYIVEHYMSKTVNDIARDLNEYNERIQYRIQVLVRHNIIIRKNERKRMERTLKQHERTMNNIMAEYIEMDAKLKKADAVLKAVT